MSVEGVGMFVQVIKGQVSDAGQVTAAMDRWLSELASGADGWLGSTSGVTEDGTLIALARFESEAAARRNSERPEQDQWWSETSKMFTGDVSFYDSDDVEVDIVGDPDAAGFVQVMRGRGGDSARARELMSENSDEWAAFRPEILATLSAAHADGSWTMAIYFTSEQAAREGETKEPPEALRAQMEEMNSLMEGEPEFYDLKQPRMDSPR
jgi:hypothetical protein